MSPDVYWKGQVDLKGGEKKFKTESLWLKKASKETVSRETSKRVRKNNELLEITEKR